MLQQILTLNLFGFILVFTRIGTAFILLPGFSAAFISVRARLFFALAVSFVVATTLSGTLPGLPNTPTELFVILAGEAVVGGFLGTLARILMSALQTAGTIIAFVSSMANAFVQDPIVDQQSSLIAGFLGNVGVLLMFATNLHHLMLEGLVDSYSLFVPGQMLAFGDFANIVGRRVMDSFALGIRLASPFLIVGLTYYIGLGLLGRLMPALPVFFVGLPLQVMMQITVLMMALSGMMMVFLENFQEAVLAFSAL